MTPTPVHPPGDHPALALAGSIEASADQAQSRRIPFAGLDRQHAELYGELRGAFVGALATSAFVLGAEVERFEAEFAAYCEVDYCIGVASGTAALTLTLLAVGIGPGDEVIVPAHTFVASALAIVHAGATPVACDVDEGTGLIDVAAAGAAIGSRTAAILPVHLYGQMCDMTALRALADNRALFLFEDAAQAHGARWEGRRAGSLGEAAAFSFYPSKNLGALGDGGAICTDDVVLATRARQLRDLGRAGSGVHRVAGYNERLDALQAAFLSVKLPHLDGWNERRRTHAATYRRLLAGRVRMLDELPEADCVHHLLPIRIAGRDACAATLDRAGVSTGVHYPRALHQQAALAGRLGGEGAFPVAEAWAREELSLPLFPELENAEVERVAVTCLAAVADGEFRSLPAGVVGA